MEHSRKNPARLKELIKEQEGDIAALERAGVPVSDWARAELEALKTQLYGPQRTDDRRGPNRFPAKPL